MKRVEGIIVKFSGHWKITAGREEIFIPTGDHMTLAGLIEKIGMISGNDQITDSDGLICLYDEERGPTALKMEDHIAPGSTLLFLGTIESG